MLVVGPLQCISLPITLASLDKHRGVQHRSGKFGNLTQAGILVISLGLKSKKLGMTLRMSLIYVIFIEIYVMIPDP
jgi:hypothetical protein